MKRYGAPRYWPVQRKTNTYVVAPRPGPHSSDKCIPVAVVLRDVLRYAENMREVKLMLNKGLVKVDGRVRRSPGFPAGIMDVVSLGDKEHYRVLSDKRGLYLKEIDEKESKFKLAKVVDKSNVPGGKTQIHLHDGGNLLDDGSLEVGTGDVLVYDFASRKAKKTFKYGKGAPVLLTGGSNIGRTGTIKDIIVTKSFRTNQALVKLGDEELQIPDRYVFVLGDKKAHINTGEDK